MEDHPWLSLCKKFRVERILWCDLEDKQKIVLLTDNNNHFVHCTNVPVSKYLRFELRKWYFDTTTGWIILWLCMARWNGPFLNGSSFSSCDRVPSGNINILLARCSMASHSLFSRFNASFRLPRSINKVPQSQAPVPNGNAYNMAFFATTVERPRMGHK